MLTVQQFAQIPVINNYSIAKIKFSNVKSKSFVNFHSFSRLVWCACVV